jgi:hypothetical protein
MLKGSALLPAGPAEMESGSERVLDDCVSEKGFCIEG